MHLSQPLALGQKATVITAHFETAQGNTFDVRMSE
jgi:hypothetical protein